MEFPNTATGDEPRSSLKAEFYSAEHRRCQYSRVDPRCIYTNHAGPDDASSPKHTHINTMQLKYQFISVPRLGTLTANAVTRARSNLAHRPCKQSCFQSTSNFLVVMTKLKHLLSSEIYNAQFSKPKQ